MCFTKKTKKNSGEVDVIQATGRTGTSQDSKAVSNAHYLVLENCHPARTRRRKAQGHQGWVCSQLAEDWRTLRLDTRDSPAASPLWAKQVEGQGPCILSLRCEFWFLLRTYTVPTRRFRNATFYLWYWMIVKWLWQYCISKIPPLCLPPGKRKKAVVTILSQLRVSAVALCCRRGYCHQGRTLVPLSYGKCVKLDVHLSLGAERGSC